MTDDIRDARTAAFVPLVLDRRLVAAAAEEEERKFYSGNAPHGWLDAIAEWK